MNPQADQLLSDEDRALASKFLFAVAWDSDNVEIFCHRTQTTLELPRELVPMLMECLSAPPSTESDVPVVDLDASADGGGNAA